MFMYCIFRYFSNENVLRIFLALVEFSNLVKLFRITDKNYASKVVVTWKFKSPMGVAKAAQERIR